VSSGGLHVEESGAGPALVLLHGFTGSAETWRPFQTAWPGRRLLAVDLPGHGRSLNHDATIAASIESLITAIDARGIDRFCVLGYSMGGRIAMRLALRHSQRVEGIILESASPGIADETARAARVAADGELAGRIERDGIEAFVAAWERLPLWASHTPLSEETRFALRRQRLANDPAGLAASLRGGGAGMVPPVLEDLASLAMPVLLITGALDSVYCDHTVAMAERLPQAQRTVVLDAGHAVHLERPQAFAEAVSEFIARV